VKVAVTGSHGLIGSALVAGAYDRGHDVVRVVRGVAGSGEAGWDPAAGILDASALAGVEAVVHLAGAGVGDHRWSAANRQSILRSRLDGTAILARTLASMPRPPTVLLSGSAVGYYGVRGDEELTEESGPGTGFLADVCARWEAATAPASAAGIRVVHLRTGVVLSAAGGALKKQLPLFRVGMGARLGSGRQLFSWITRRDFAAAVWFLIARDELSGPVNVTGPAPVSNAEFTRALGRAVHRPARLVVPAVVLRGVAGRDMSTEFLLASQRVIPHRLIGAGFTFADAQLPGALETALADRSLTPSFA
jgi:uncharacterized protein